MKFVLQEQVFILSPSEARAPTGVPPLLPPSGFKPIPSPPLELVQPLLSSDLVIQHLNRLLMLRLGSGNTRRSFNRGLNYLLVKSIQELHSKKEGIVAVGIGGPSGSGKLSLAKKVASMIGCSVISMENYGTGSDEGNDLNSIDFDLLVQNLQEKLIHHLEMKCRPTYLTWNVGSPAQLSFSAREIVDGTFLKEIEDYEPISKRLLKLYHGDPVLNLLTPCERPPMKNIFCIYEVDSRTEDGNRQFQGSMWSSNNRSSCISSAN
ncbi:hypothetical protein SSX86_007698 [Deinandra increscens subsp. villosa]|uniref:Uncharacterized protein n=1 Tax=Deinandra increscens subsp. villosa TaxID=3103831 RepID=A0AAP0DLN0_9ASTR